MRLIDEYGCIHCTPMMAKARETPRRFVSIALLELVAGVLAVKLSALIKRELEMEELTEYCLIEWSLLLSLFT